MNKKVDDSCYSTRVVKRWILCDDSNNIVGELTNKNKRKMFEDKKTEKMHNRNKRTLFHHNTQEFQMMHCMPRCLENYGRYIIQIPLFKKIFVVSSTPMRHRMW